MRKPGFSLMPSSIRSSYLAICLVAALTLGVLGTLALTLAHSVVLDSQKAQLKDQTLTVKNALAMEFPQASIGTFDIPALRNWVRDLSSGGHHRLTITGEDGKVLADSQADPAYMENHAARPEIVAARDSRPEWDIRYSHTLNVYMLYYAETLGVITVRLATPLSWVQDLEQGFLRFFPAAFIASVLVLVLAAILLYRRLMPPLQKVISMAEAYRQGGITHIPFIDHPRELELIARAMKTMAEELRSSIGELEERNNEMRLVLDSIQEAVLVLDRHQVIHRCNKAAIQLFRSQDEMMAPDPDAQSARDSVRGTHLLSWLRSSALADLLDQAMAGTGPREGEVELPRNLTINVWSTPFSQSSPADAPELFLAVLSRKA